MKVFLAATKVLRNYQEEIEKSKYILESYYDIEKWQLPHVKKCSMFLLDSGAFTFMNSGKVLDFDAYTEKYIDFIRENDMKYFFEMDIDSVVGYEKVKVLRKKIERRTGKQPIPVWHYSRGKDDYIGMCKDYPYVAFGGLMTDGVKREQLLKYMPWFIDKAHENNAMIHGLGFTHTRILDKYHFDTVDSSSWIGGQRYGLEYRFEDGIVKQIKREGKRLVNYQSLMVHNFNEWCKFQRYAENHL